MQKFSFFNEYFTNSPCVTCNDLRRIHILNVTKCILLLRLTTIYLNIFFFTKIDALNETVHASMFIL